jgi:hypothetical protein
MQFKVGELAIVVSDDGVDPELRGQIVEVVKLVAPCYYTYTKQNEQAYTVELNNGHWCVKPPYLKKLPPPGWEKQTTSTWEKIKQITGWRPREKAHSVN